MAARNADRFLGFALVIISGLWCWAVVATIDPVDDGSRLGARGFPMGLGMLLGILGLMVLVRSFGSQEDAGAGEEAGEVDQPASQAWAVCATVGLLVFYAAALQYTGFVFATFTTVAVAVGPVLGLWRPRLILGMSTGLSLGIYLIFGKLLGVYLPYGTWFTIAF